MNTHIVRVNETPEKIANLYHISIEEMVKINLHIKDWNNLIPGTKLRLPEISEMLQLELDNTEPFIEEYYPKIEIEQPILINQEVEPVNSNIENSNNNNNSNSSNITTNHSSKSSHSYLYPPYYTGGYFNPYYPYGYYRKSPKRKNKK